jgi:2-iminobutanoate/2-iminopropanoate deaminase
MIRDTILSPDAPQPLGPYSQAVRAGGFLFVAGQLPIDKNGVLIGQGDITQQTETVLGHMAAILREAGSSMENVVKTTVFLTNLDDFKAMNDVYARSFTAPFPARSTVEINRLPNSMLIEIECVALA